MYCSRCGSGSADEAAFCWKCGNYLAQAAAPPATPPLLVDGAPNYPPPPYTAPQTAVPAQTSPIRWYLSPWKRFVLFEGRAGRPEFWWFTLGQFIINLALLMLSIWAGLSIWADVVVLLWYVFVFAAILPSIAVTARRLHDIGQSGWLQLVVFIPLVGPVVLLVLCAMASKPGPNQYGPEPLPPAG
jgi:uncharacterized membrane protein YhaH (DUF805 family)